MALAERRYRRNRIVRFNRQPVQTVSAFPRLQPKGTSSFIFQSSFISVPRPYSALPGKAQKSSDLSIGASCWRYLSSRAVTRKVLSAQMSLTSVFGMGTGVPSPQSTPTIRGHTLKTEQE